MKTQNVIKMNAGPVDPESRMTPDELLSQASKWLLSQGGAPRISGLESLRVQTLTPVEVQKVSEGAEVKLFPTKSKD